MELDRGNVRMVSAVGDVKLSGAARQAVPALGTRQSTVTGRPRAATHSSVISDKQTPRAPTCLASNSVFHQLPSCLSVPRRSTNVSRRTHYGGSIIFWKMTEGPLLHHDKPMCVRIWLEVGHACEPRRSSLGRALALDWRVWVRGVSGRDISAFVHKVVFYLRPSAAFVYPKRVLQEPPYEIQESGCASIDIPIHVYLKYTSQPKRIRLRYSLQIENNTRISSESRCVYYDFENPPEELCRALVSSGGEVVSRAAKRLVVLLSDDERPTMKPKKYKFIEPVLHCKHVKKRTKSYILEDICSKCGESTTADLRKQLRAVAMTDSEINQVSQLYLAYTSYEKSIDALVLPPLSDPIYKVPDIPASLKEALKAAEFDSSL